jgi:hypothetical protein
VSDNVEKRFKTGDDDEKTPIKHLIITHIFEKYIAFY